MRATVAYKHLYEAWNMAFVMGEYENYPAMMAKLVIPEVLCHPGAT